MSVDFLYGPTPASVDVFVTSLSTHGGGDNFLSGYSLASPSVHGLFWSRTEPRALEALALAAAASALLSQIFWSFCPDLNLGHH
jgi:hypothetical protein